MCACLLIFIVEICAYACVCVSLDMNVCMYVHMNLDMNVGMQVSMNLDMALQMYAFI